MTWTPSAVGRLWKRGRSEIPEEAVEYEAATHLVPYLIDERTRIEGLAQGLIVLDPALLEVGGQVLVQVAPAGGSDYLRSPPPSATPLQSTGRSRRAGAKPR